MTIQTTIVYTRRQNWSNQFTTLGKANAAAETAVIALQKLGGVTDQNSTGTFTPDQQKAYDQAKLNHLNANAALVGFLRDTSLNLSRESGRLILIAADPLVNAFDRDNANRSSQVIAEQAAEFQSFKTEQGWTYPASINYQVGNRALTSSPSGLVDIANPTSFLGGLKAGIQQWMAAVNTAGAQNVQTLKDNGVELSDVDACIAAVDKIKSAVLKNFVQTPDYFKNGPGSLLDPTKPLNPLDWERKSMGERLFSKGLGSTITVDTAMCRLIFSKQDGLELMQQFGLVDAEFLRQMDSLSADIVLAVPRQIFDRVFATDIAINQLATTGALSQFDSQIQATEAQMGSANGFQDVYASSLNPNISP